MATNGIKTSLKNGALNAVNGTIHANGLANGDGSKERKQVINDEKQFTPDLTKQITRWGLQDAGFNYNIVAVFGSQSTGKSTLLNRLFGTNFDVMDETRRQQTTKGIWMCKGQDMNVMVMDVEGTDGRERGEDQDFERKSALFSLASSEVLIVNLWEHQIGLYQGANMGLLKTVFEVNLGLFGKGGATDQRTLLLFVIRDHIGTTPLKNLAATLEVDLNRIWEGLSKPPGLESCKLSDFFDLSFTGLPHKILAAQQFEDSVASLRRRFADRSSLDYVFKPSYHKRIPADGVAFYMSKIWEQVQSNKDLDLPTQQELLAQFRCDEISAAALAEFSEQAKSQKKPIESGKVVEGLGEMMRAWRTRALTKYDTDASRYHQGVYKRKRTDLMAAMDATLSPLFLGQLKNLHKASLAAFKRSVLEGLTGEYSFADVVGTARTKSEKDFEAGAKEAVVEEEDAQWAWQEELALLKEEIRLVADQCRKDETKKMVNNIERNFKKQISEPVDLALSRATPDMWDKVLRTFQEMLAKAEKTYLTKAKSFNSTEDENKQALATLRKRAWLALRAKVDEQTADAAIVTKLRAHFEERFRYDEDGTPRVWRPDDDIDGAFKKAKDATLALIPLYASIKSLDPELAVELPSEAGDGDGQGGDEFDFAATLRVLSETRARELGAAVRRDADAAFVEAKRSTVSSIAQIPVWMYGVLVVLGWNEAMAVLFNPLYFTMLLVGMGTAYAIVKLNLVGPLFQITKSIGGEMNRQAQGRMREHFSQPALAEPVRTKPLEDALEDDEVRQEIRRRRAQ